MHRLTFILLILVFFCSCEETVSFNQPQPTDTKSLSEFPKKLQGSYLNKQGNPLLKIGANLITRIYDYDVKISKKDLDSNTYLVNDTLYVSNTREKMPVKIEGDSLLEHIYTVDTLFLISDRNVLKKFKGYYFLNYADSIYWHVDKLTLSKGNLSIARISTQEEIKSLQEITETTTDTVSYKFSPSKQQFRNFIRKGGFKDTSIYERIRE